MKTTAPTIIGNDCLNIQETSVCHSMNANCHNKAKRIIDAKARIIKPTQNSTPFSPSNNTHHLILMSINILEKPISELLIQNI